MSDILLTNREQRLRRFRVAIFWIVVMFIMGLSIGQYIGADVRYVKASVDDIGRAYNTGYSDGWTEYKQICDKDEIYGEGEDETFI